ncbi:MAG: DUF4430 domain-containing protein [Patescibacteria group bacterium]
MYKNNKKLYVSLSIILISLVFFLISSSKKENKTSHSAISPISAEKNNESITILVGQTTAHLSVLPNTFLYDALIQAKNAGKISFSGKNYPGLGFFVTDIGTLHSSNGKNLIYYINGQEAMVGVSSYILKGGDIILWELK